MFFGSLYGLSHKKLRNAIDESLEIMGLSKFADKK
jgi:ABC-2 type transport system ATP-binding protein